MERLITVAVPIPGLDLLTYRVPDGGPLPARGARVLVPVGRRLMTGCVVDPAASVPEAAAEGVAGRELREIAELLDEEAYLPAEPLDLALWVAGYYVCGAGEAVAAAWPPQAAIASERRVQITEMGRAEMGRELLPPARLGILRALADGRAVRMSSLRRAVALRDRGAEGGGVPPSRAVEADLLALERAGLIGSEQTVKGRGTAAKTVRVVSLTAHGQAWLEAPAHGVTLGARQLEGLRLLAATASGLALPELGRHGVSSESIRRLLQRGLVAIRRERFERDPFAGEPRAGANDATPEWTSDRALTDEQTRALADLTRLADSGIFQTTLVHGVTGSGKSELYLRLARHVVGGGRSVLLLVPEIALTPAVTRLFRASFGSRVAVQHSGLSSGERYDQWHRIRRGEVDVVVGTRSAVFAPLPRLGLVIVDEEHDPSYKQEEAPRYHGRDVAVMRGKRSGALVVLGSATPSMETYQNALSGRYHRVILTRRVEGRALATVRIVDMREEYAAEGPDVILSARLREAMGDRLTRGEQVLVLLNRRGYARAVFCRQCGGTLECPNCSVSLTVHRAGRRAVCHYCNYSRHVPTACGHCAAPYLEQAGFGTERVEAEVRALFPDARVGRLDRDTVRGRGRLQALLEGFATGGLQVLVGTQMVAKGHDFPNVTLVGVISADVGLGLADFRAAERTFQLLTQVAGRAGRGMRAGEAIVQTLYPEHYSIQHACRQDYVAFYGDEIRFREAMRYPPVLGLVNGIVRARTAEAAMRDGTEIVERLRATGFAYRVMGPAPAPLARLRGEHRAQFFLKGSNRATMRHALQSVLSDLPELRRRVTIDVDPVSML